MAVATVNIRDKGIDFGLAGAGGGSETDVRYNYNDDDPGNIKITLQKRVDGGAWEDIVEFVRYDI